MSKYFDSLLISQVRKLYNAEWWDALEQCITTDVEESVPNPF
jgi:hypothetical protein